MGRVAFSMYPDTSSALDWINEELKPIEESSFKYWRKLAPLVRICEDSVHKRKSIFAAHAAVRQWNNEHGTNYSYEEILGRTMDNYLFADCGDWAAFTRLQDQEEVLFGRYDTIETALAYASPAVEWGALWIPDAQVIYVYRSPFIKPRWVWETENGFLEDTDGTPLCDGLRHGREPAFVFPDLVEGSIQQDLKMKDYDWR